MIKSQKILSRGSFNFYSSRFFLVNTNVAAAATGATINLSQKVKVGEAVNNAVVSYTGLGEIRIANNLVSGVTFETAPKSTTGEKSEGGKTEDAEATGEKAITAFPANKETGVGVSDKIVLTFSTDIFAEGGEKVTASYIQNKIQLRKTASTGTKVEYKASFSNENKITITPSSKLTAGTKYYVIVPAGTFEDDKGEAYEKFTTYFTTAGGDDKEDSSSDDEEKSE